ncbi:MAG: M1 family metallopeptidase [Alphaproteobacteria bacterium]|nr:M1 family metallopeptidase [Alphaproteobacteria bacterium]MBU1514785.1 M1 family metallopeptidase [Alphaproteobacteria bacterium]MBU2093916.1 M1 family metallopeptidase [Alphaproteobacteria bacterium]MBU2153343.1 M1 family metallopeptidase [Alphaproteobacteria bacterium]MBU2309771.1 M1 family metallopeptidase [Alphaproteobacteria bacterium]
MKRLLVLLGVGLAALVVSSAAVADPVTQTKAPFKDAFRQLEGEEWPTPNDYRSASGAPGYRYWQQKVDYKIQARLDEPTRTVTGKATITYKNNSPDRLTYLWLLLDQNVFKRDSIAERTATVGSGSEISLAALRRVQRYKDWEGGFRLISVTDAGGRKIPHTVVDSLMRVDLAQTLASGGTTTLVVEWSYPMIENKVIGGRDGYECFTKPGEDGNCTFLGAQWFPRLARYTDYEGWHNKAFLGSGEFTLEFGDYEVALTVPNDHVVASTGDLTNPGAVLTVAQRQRLEQARTSKEPVYIVTPPEALAAEGRKPTGEKTWVFRASNVRDFAWASSRKFVWDALGVKQDSAEQPLVMAMSFYPKEARPLWDAWSTKAIAHTLHTYNDFAFPYPYPKAQSINGITGGMEYPMMTFNGPRPTKDPKTGDLTYSERTKAGLIGVVIHEIGHTYFPMVVNSDERQWTWMDEGLNSFLQFQAEKRWSKDFPSRRGEPKDVVEYMVSQNQVPVMTQSDSLLQFGSNSYHKPAVALVILRETVLGRDLFDKAFKDYATRWRFKGPTPYDFFRTMEESSGVDLDWFWRGWFYSTDHVDIALEGVTAGRLEPADADAAGKMRREKTAAEPPSLTASRNTATTVVERDPAVRDYYETINRDDATEAQRKKAKTANEDLTPEERVARNQTDTFYRFKFRNLGGLVMPVILKMDFADGSTETIRIPAEIWRKNAEQVTWQYVSAKTLKRAELDPLWETADADRDNNIYEGAGVPRVLKLAKPDDESESKLKDNDLKVMPDSLQTYPATPKPIGPGPK